MDAPFQVIRSGHGIVVRAWPCPQGSRAPRFAGYYAAIWSPGTLLSELAVALVALIFLLAALYLSPRGSPAEDVAPIAWILSAGFLLCLVIGLLAKLLRVWALSGSGEGFLLRIETPPATPDAAPGKPEVRVSIRGTAVVNPRRLTWEGVDSSDRAGESVHPVPCYAAYLRLAPADDGLFSNRRTRTMDFSIEIETPPTTDADLAMREGTWLRDFLAAELRLTPVSVDKR